MKLRNGFVSNSSSSSFLVVFDNKPQSAEEIQKILFGDEKTILYKTYQHIEAFASSELTNTIYNDIKRQDPNDIKAITTEMEHLGHCHDWYTKEGAGYVTSITKDLFALVKYPPDAMDELRKNLGNIPRGTKTPEYKAYWEEHNRLYKIQDKAIKSNAKIMAAAFIKKYKDKFIYCLEYSDESGLFFACLEHGDTFKNIPYIRINKH
jgi:hypothetical protein